MFFSCPRIPLRTPHYISPHASLSVMILAVLRHTGLAYPPVGIELMIFPWSDWIARSWEADDRVKVHAHYVMVLTRVPPCWCWYPSLAEEVFVRVFRCKATPFPSLPAVAFMRKWLCTVSIRGVGSHALPHWEQTVGLHYPALFRRERCLFLSDSLSCVKTRLVSVDFDLYCELDWPHLPPGR